MRSTTGRRPTSRCCGRSPRRAGAKSRLSEYAAQQQALSRFAIGAAVLSEPVLAVLRRELRRMSPEARIDTAQIREILLDEVIKREVIEGDKASEAKRAVSRAARRAASRRAERTDAAKEEVAKAPVGEVRG